MPAKGSNPSAKRQAIAKSLARKGLPVSSALLANDTLTDKQKGYVEGRASGMNKRDAATAAGYRDPSGDAKVLEQLPAINEAMASERAANARLMGFTRADVLQGIKSAIDDAKILADPQAQIAGWREVAKICGYYAPEEKRITLTAGQLEARGQMEMLSDDELLQLAAGRPAIEGSFTRAPDNDQASRADNPH